MPGFCVADHAVSPPRIVFPREYNLAHDLIGRNLAAGRVSKAAYIDARGTWTYGALSARANRFANALGALGIEPEQRIMLCLLDDIDFPTTFLGSILAGVVPVAVNTMLTTRDYDYMLRDSRCRALVVSQALLPVVAPLLAQLPTLRHVIVAGEAAPPHRSLEALLDAASDEFSPAATTPDDPCFWLYSSGSTGSPKGTIHAHASAVHTAELHGRPVVGIREDDVVFSAAKLFFAYGLGNALSFPMSVGATTVLLAGRPTPEAVFETLRRSGATVFCGVPTLYAAMLASRDLPPRESLRVRVCTSAGEALPAELGKRWTAHFGSEILDGIGSTEMLHVFVSNRPGEVRYGSTGRPVPGYNVRVIDDAGNAVAPGEIGELQVEGPTAAIGYWNNREKSRSTFLGPWTRCGDKYTVDADGYYTYVGRIDDMLKVGGIYVSPIEVEFALATHPAVLESAVIGRNDEAALTKPAAFVVLKSGHAPSPALAEELKQHVKGTLAAYKYPRWVEFVSELPKTATGKIQRFKLREMVARS